MSERYTISGADDTDTMTVVAEESGQRVPLPDASLRLIATLVDGPRQIDDLIDAVWQGTPPRSATAAIHNRLSKLRKLAPDLVGREHDRYCLGPGVSVDDGGGTHDPGPDPDLRERIDRARRRVFHDPHDEQARSNLIASLAAAGQRTAALTELERATDDLAEVGLEPGRRLTDLARLVVDGEKRIERLLGDELDALDVGMAIGTFAMDDVADAARRWLVDDGDGVLLISGPDGSGRSHALRVVRDLAIGLGRDVASIRAHTTSRLPVIPVGAARSIGGVVVTVDDLDRANSATQRLIDRMANRWAGRPLKVVATARSAEASTALELAADLDVAMEHIELHHWDDDNRQRLIERLDLDDDQLERAAIALGRGSSAGVSNRTTIDALRLAFGDAGDRSAFDRLIATKSRVRASSDTLDAAVTSFMVDSLDPAGRHLVELLALTVTPVLLDDLDQLSPGARQQLRRREVRRLLDVDELSGRVRTRDLAVDRAVLDRMSPRRQVELHTVLSRADYQHEESAVRARRHAAHGAEADLSAVDAARSVTSLADAVAATGDRLTAADISQLAADVVLPVDPERFCELSIRAGTELLTAGDPVGLDAIETAFEIATANGLVSLAASATWSYCRLGPTSGAGQLDERATEMLETVEPIIDDHADRALVSTAWAMVHQLTGDSERCATAYDRAERHARATGRDDLLIVTLPASFMSIPTPDHLDRREAIAEELHQLAARSGRVDAEWEALHLDLSNQLQRGDPAIRSTVNQLDEATARLGGAQHDWEQSYLSAVVAQVDGDLDAALRHAEASLGARGAIGDSRRTAVFGAILLGNHLATNTVAELAPLLEQMIADQPLLGAWRAPLALAATELGRSDQAAEQLEWLTRPGSIDRDCTMSAVAAVAGTAAARLIGLGAATSGQTPADDPERLARWFVELLTPWSGRWSWYGAGTYGPIDTVLAELHRSLGHHDRATELAVAATAQTARMRAPIHAQAAATLLL